MIEVLADHDSRYKMDGQRQPLITAMKPEIKSNLECARYCVKEQGGKFVLLSKEKVYKLDAQTLAEPWVGVKVKVLGTLDPKTELITVERASARRRPFRGPDRGRIEAPLNTTIA